VKPLEQAIQLIEGERCSLKCIIKGNPKPSITWYLAFLDKNFFILDHLEL
jgi:hypothetical protein